MKLTLTDREKRWGVLYLLLQMFLIPNACAAVCLLLGIYSDTAANVLAFYTNALLAPVFFRELLKQSARNARWYQILGIALKGLVLYWVLSILTAVLIFALAPDFSNLNDAGVNAMLDDAPWLMSIAVVFAAPLAEECLFRGWIFTGLAQKSIPLAYTATAGFFSAAHVAGYIGSCAPTTLLLCFLQYLGPSFALCWTCRKADSLLPPLLLHMTINTITLFTTR